MSTNPSFSIPEPGHKHSLASSMGCLEYYWKQFTDEFPTEEACVHELYMRVYNHCIKCLECGSKKTIKLNNSRVIICNDCKKESHTLSSTFFHGIRRAQSWLGAIWFMEHGVRVSASGFARLADIVSSTAQGIFKKLSLVVVSKMSELPEIASGEFVFTFCKRSRMTPAGEHPIAEQSEIEREYSADLELRVDAASADSKSHLQKSKFKDGKSKELCPLAAEDELSDLERKVYEALSTEPTLLDILCQRTAMDAGKLIAALVMLELKGLVKPGFGNRYSLSNLPGFPGPPPASACSGQQAKAMICSFVDFVRSTFQGISRKHLQNYLGWYWCIVDRKRWKPGSLLKECCGFRRISCKEILEYVSPVMVKTSLALDTLS